MKTLIKVLRLGRDVTIIVSKLRFVIYKFPKIEKTQKLEK